MIYEQRKDGDEFCISPEHYIRCCDCGAVHKIKARKHKGKFYLRTWSAPKRTRRARRKNAIMVVKMAK